MESLDNILSGRGEAMPAPETTEVEATPAETIEPVTTEAEPAGETAGQKMVPHEALHAEKQKVKRYTEEVADFKKQMAENNAQWERRIASILESVKPKQEQAQPDWYENPNAAAQHAIAPQLEQFQAVLNANAKLIAGTKFGDSDVQEAEDAFVQAVQSQTLDPADYHKVVNSPNRYAAAVQWHKRQKAQAEIGDDPAAFRAKLEAEILAKHGIQPGAQPAAQTSAPAPVMPSNLAAARNVGARSGPAWSGPTPLADIFKR